MIVPTDQNLQELVRALVAAGSVGNAADLDAVEEIFKEAVIDGYDDGPVPQGMYASVTRMMPAVARGPQSRIYDTDADAFAAYSEMTNYETGEYAAVRGDGVSESDPADIYVALCPSGPDTEVKTPGADLDAWWLAASAESCPIRINHDQVMSGSWDIQWHGFTGGPSPFDFANRFATWCRSADGIAKMDQHGVSFVDCTPVRDLTAVVSDETWEPRAGLEFQMSYLQRVTAVVGSIDQAELNIRIFADPVRVNAEGDAIPDAVI